MYNSSFLFYDYIYLQNMNDINTHIEICRSCDYEKILPHTMDFITKRCIFCNASLSGGIIGGGEIMKIHDDLIYFKEEEIHEEN